MAAERLRRAGPHERGQVHYGPHRLVIRRRTKSWDPISSLHSRWFFSDMLLVDHYHGTSGYAGNALNVLSELATDIPLRRTLHHFHSRAGRIC